MKTFNNERMKKVCLFFCKIFFLLLIICFFLRYKDAFKSDFKNLYNLYKIKREIKNTIKSNYKGVDKVKYKSASQCDSDKCIIYLGTCFKYEKIKNCKKYYFDVYMKDKFIIKGYVMYKNNKQKQEDLYYNLNHYKTVKKKIDNNIKYSKVLYSTTIYNNPDIKIYSNENLKEIIIKRYIKSLVDTINSNDIDMTIKYKDSILSTDCLDCIYIRKKLNYKDYSNDRVEIYYNESIRNRSIEKVKHFLN